ncbi:MAG: DUF2797 domain-containing protein [Euryarchaeota archaeon]|nr:DUF2797 domain-containing protein [Euryarchaeota archaeon]
MEQVAMEGFLLRDTRHLAGKRRESAAPPPEGEGLALSYHWVGTKPVLTVRTDKGPVDLPLTGRLDLQVEEGRFCIGHRTSEGLQPCPDRRPADRFIQCAACHPLTNRECVFEPRCTDCTLPFCRGAHQVYVAWYGLLPKIGMTRSVREDARLVEQGADAYAFLASVPDRFAARRMEDKISARAGVPQSRRPKELLTQTARSVPWNPVVSAHEAFIERVTGLEGLDPGPLVRLPESPGAWPLPEVPTPVAEVGRHTGHIIAAKGKWVFYKDGEGPLWALRMSAVEGHEVRFDPGVARPFDKRGTTVGQPVDEDVTDAAEGPDATTE